MTAMADDCCFLIRWGQPGDRQKQRASRANGRFPVSARN